jgi:hypothetical protein
MFNRRVFKQTRDLMKPASIISHVATLAEVQFGRNALAALEAARPNPRAGCQYLVGI